MNMMHAVVNQFRGVPESVRTLVAFLRSVARRMLPVLRKLAVALVFIVATACLAFVLLPEVGGQHPVPLEAQTVSYTVQPGDTLWSIAGRNVDHPGQTEAMVRSLRQLNGLDSSSLRAGQHLLIPVD